MSEECRTLYLLLSRKLDAVIEELRSKDVRLDKVEKENRDLRDKLNELESRMDDVDCQNRGKNLILSGKTVKTISKDNMTDSVIQLLCKSIKYELPPENLLATYRVGVRSSMQSPDGRGVMLKLRENDTKRDIMSACRTVRPPDLYANDDLIPSRARILYLLRQAKRKSGGKLAACGSQNGNVFAIIKPPNESARNQKVFIRTMSTLESLCERELKISLGELTGTNSIE